MHTEVNAKISGRIIHLMTQHEQATGAGRDASLRWAFDKVLGVGAFACLASDLHDAMTAKAI